MFAITIASSKQCASLLYKFDNPVSWEACVTVMIVIMQEHTGIDDCWKSGLTVNTEQPIVDKATAPMEQITRSLCQD